jgi:hypothetical protein
MEVWPLRNDPNRKPTVPNRWMGPVGLGALRCKKYTMNIYLLSYIPVLFHLEILSAIHAAHHAATQAYVIFEKSQSYKKE